MTTFGTPKKTITFTIEDGEVTSEAHGFTGKACEAATKFFTDALGGKTTKKTFKPEYYKTEKSFASQTAGN
jgi:hypothetical protein